MPRGPAPNDERRRRVEPAHEWRWAGGIGWQHGAPPPPPAKLLGASREAWQVWFRAWFAAFWTPDDLPGLRQLIRLYDQVERGEFQRHGELRIGMDTYGITPKGQQDRRWKPPTRPDVPQEAEAGESERPSASGGRYAHLRSVAPGA